MLYVGDIASEVFSTSVAGETFSRAASYIDNTAVTWNPTFIDLGGGYYRYTYTALQVGAHEWVGSGSSTGPIAINFDVDATPVTTTEITNITQLPSPAAAAFGSAATEERLPVRFDLTGEWAIIQGADWDWPIRLEVDTLPAPPFEPSSPYVLGNYVTPTSGNETGFTYVVVVAGTAGASEPSWPIVMGGRVVSGGVGFMACGATRMIDTAGALARMEVRTEHGGTLGLLASVANGAVFMDFDPPRWEASTAYVLGDRILSQTLNGWVYECVDAGTSAASAPTWPTTLGASVADGGVIWRNVMTDDGASNLRIQLTNAVTAALTTWGVGSYDFEYYDAFGVTTRILEGAAELSEEVTT